MSSEITDEQLEQFHAFAESLDSSVQELVETLAAEGKRSRQARDQVSKVLSAGAGASVVASVKREYETVDDSQQALLAFTNEVIARSIAELMPDDSGRAEAVPHPVQMTPGEAFAKLKAMGLALDEVKMYRALTLASMNLAITSYNDMCEAFLGYEIGSHDARRRFGRWFAKFGVTLAGELVPPIGWVTEGGGLVKEAVEQAQANPLHERVNQEKKSAAGEDARAALKELAADLLTNIEFVEESVSGMLRFYAEEYAAMKALQTQLAAFFEDPPAD